MRWLRSISAAHPAGDALSVFGIRIRDAPPLGERGDVCLRVAERFLERLVRQGHVAVRIVEGNRSGRDLNDAAESAASLSLEPIGGLLEPGEVALNQEEEQSAEVTRTKNAPFAIANAVSRSGSTVIARVREVRNPTIQIDRREPRR